MEKIRLFLIAFALSFTSHPLVAQNPDFVDPGNARGDESTKYLWENPEYYIPVLVIVVLIVSYGIFKKSRKKNG